MNDVDIIIRCLHTKAPYTAGSRRARQRGGRAVPPAPLATRHSPALDSLHLNVFLRRRTFNLYAYISSECDVNFVHCRIVYSLESHLVYKIWDSERIAQATCNMFVWTQTVRTSTRVQTNRRERARTWCALASYLKTELLRLKYSRALLDPQLGKLLQSFFKRVAFSDRVWGIRLILIVMWHEIIRRLPVSTPYCWY